MIGDRRDDWQVRCSVSGHAWWIDKTQPRIRGKTIPLKCDEREKYFLSQVNGCSTLPGQPGTEPTLVLISRQLKVKVSVVFDWLPAMRVGSRSIHCAYPLSYRPVIYRSLYLVSYPVSYSTVRRKRQASCPKNPSWFSDRQIAPLPEYSKPTSESIGNCRVNDWWYVSV